MSQLRGRSGSISSAPPSESSEGTLTDTSSYINQNWNETDGQQKQHSSPKNPKEYFFGVNNLIKSNDDNTISNPEYTILSLSERQQIENFFASLGTNIFVSKSLANLYEICGKDKWNLLYTGIPVILHDKGSARSRSTPSVQFCFAERGSCFTLWHDIIDHLSQYRACSSSFHTMCLSTDHRKVIGFSFDSSESAQQLWQHIEKLTNDPKNISLNVPGTRKKKKQKKLKPISLPPKSQISYPCQFQHVTSVTREDVERYYSLQAFVALQDTGKHNEKCKI